MSRNHQVFQREAGFLIGGLVMNGLATPGMSSHDCFATAEMVARLRSKGLCKSTLLPLEFSRRV